MKHFTIDNENNITLHSNRQAARDTGAAVFTSEIQFADLIGNDNKRLLDIWNSLPGVTPVKKFTNRKVATERIWRALQNLGGPVAPEPTPTPEQVSTSEPGPEPEAATLEIDATHATPAIEAPAPQATSESAADQHEAAPEPQSQQDGATLAAEPEVVASVSAQAPDVEPAEAKATKKASRAKKAPVATTNASVPREGSKTSRVISMLKREGGATLEEIMSAMAWQQHTTRALMSAGGALAKKHGLVVTSEKIGDQRTYFIKA